jgi:predicted O-linked N-acetylglucosamine transferase (SPINDLY family)
MGVPVVTLVGSTVVGRAGLCQALNLGLPELVATTPDEFVSAAARLAEDLDALGALRQSLRERMERSPLMDAERFARNLEAKYREAWRRIEVRTAIRAAIEDESLQGRANAWQRLQVTHV